MKNLLLALLSVLLSPGLINAQDAIDRFYSDLWEADHTKISLNDNVFKLAAAFSDEEDGSFSVEAEENGKSVLQARGGSQSFLDKVISARILVIEEAVKSKGLEDRLSSDFEELMIIEDGKDKVKCYLRTEGNSIREFFMLASDSSDELVLIDVIGNFQENDFNQVMNQFGSFTDSDPGKDAGQMKLSPNPVKSGEMVQVILEEKLNGARVSVYDSNSRRVYSKKNPDSILNLNTEDLSRGIYVVKAERDGFSVKRKLVVQ